MPDAHSSMSEICKKLDKCQNAFVFTDFLVVNLHRTALTMNIIIYRCLEFVTSEQQNKAKANVV